ncbi:MAG: hypothetical protein KatS3mg068_0169 [Candidatus Sericytochromatia bacterium]|nr:MAG: hypothetical protein KatS3mg068_0169 [Candidatus Sericytochromatia bacterium]
MKKIYFLTLLSLIFSCSIYKKEENNLNLIESVNKLNVTLLIEQKKTSGELISIGPKAVKKLAINGFELPLTKLLEEQLKINISDITVGKHELELSLYILNQDLKIPIIIPNVGINNILFLMRLNIDEKTKDLIKLEYGYDFDNNNIIDFDRGIFETTDAKTFFVNLPNNQKLEISTAFDKIINTSENNVIPPGAVPYNPPQSIDTNISQKNDLNIPKPIINNDNIYPILPVEDDKKEN